MTYYRALRTAHLASATYKLVFVFLLALVFAIFAIAFRYIPSAFLLTGGLILFLFSLAQMFAALRVTGTTPRLVHGFLFTIGLIEAVTIFPLGTLVHYQGLRHQFTYYTERSGHTP